MQNVLYILLALVVLLVLITVHEFGHFIAGKIFGFKINEFAIGFGPKLYSKTNKKTGEVFSIRLLPLGGYCAFEGEDEENPSKDAFNNKAPWKRLIVLVSGVLFNFIFGIITAAIFLMVNGYGVVHVTDFSPNNINYTSGLLKKDDVIVAVDGKHLEAYRTISDLLSKYKEGDEIVLTVQRKNSEGKTEEIDISGVKMVKTEAFYFSSNISGVKDLVYKFDEGTSNYVLVSTNEFYDEIKNVTPVKNAETGKFEDFSFGTKKFYKKVITDGVESYVEYSDEDLVKLAKIVLSDSKVSVGFIYYNQRATYGFFESFLKAWPFCFYICGLILKALGGIFTGKTALKELGGTVTAISQIAEVSKLGINNFLLLLPMLAMNLALFNILPIPALDGARCVFVIIEWICGKPVPRKIENIIHTVGLFVLLGLVLFLDVYHFFFAMKLIL